MLTNELVRGLETICGCRQKDFAAERAHARGFSIIETLVASVILILVAMILVVSIQSANTVSRGFGSVTTTYDSAREAIYEMESRLRSAQITNINTTCSGPSECHIYFKLPIARDSGGYAVWPGIGYDTTKEYKFVYNLATGTTNIYQLLFQESGKPDRVLAYNVSGLTLDLLNASGDPISTPALPCAEDNVRGNSCNGTNVNDALKNVRFLRIRLTAGADTRKGVPNWGSRTVSTRIMFYNQQ